PQQESVNDDVGFHVPRALDAGNAIRCNRDFVSGDLEAVAQPIREIRVVFDDEHRAFSLRSRCALSHLRCKGVIVVRCDALASEFVGSYENAHCLVTSSASAPAYGARPAGMTTRSCVRS